MIIKNLTDRDIGPITYEGYEFTILPGVNAVYTPFGEYILRRLFKVEATEEGEGGAPPVIETDEKDWDGTTYAQVSRFKVEHSRIPNRNDLIRLAESRGVDKELIEKFRHEDIENEEIARIINELPVPEDIRFSHRKEEEKVSKK